MGMREREELTQATRKEAAMRQKAKLERSLQPHSLSVRPTRMMGQRLASISDAELHTALEMMRRENGEEGTEHAPSRTTREQPRVETADAYAYIATTGGGNRGRFKLG